MLVSDTDQAVYYGFEIIPEVTTDTAETSENESDNIATYGVDYTITITPDSAIDSIDDSYEGISFTTDNVATDPYAITNNQMVYIMPPADDVDDKITQTFTVTVNPTTTGSDEDGNPIYKMGDGEIAKFSIQVSTSEAEHFQVDLSASFQLTMSEDVEFISETSASHPEDSNVVTYSLSTTYIDDDDPMKEIWIEWDPDIMYINEFESTAFKIIAADTDGSSFSKAEGWIIIPLQAYSSINLQFFLVDSDHALDSGATYNDLITASVRGEDDDEEVVVE